MFQKFKIFMIILLGGAIVYLLYNPREINKESPDSFPNDSEEVVNNSEQMDTITSDDEVETNESGSFEEEEYKYIQIDSLEIPEIEEGLQVIRHTAYTAAYNEIYEQAEWVAYELLCSEINGPVRRTDNFKQDPEVLTETAEKRDYIHSGYDRGHLMPAADNSQDIEAMKESFYFSNISPQKPELNRRLWRILEEQVRKWTCKFDKIYIVTGGVLEPGLETIGPNKVAVPEYYYKALLIYEEDLQTSIAFYMKNEKLEGNISDYTISIDSLESVLNFDLYHKLPDRIEDSIESEVIENIWFDVPS